ncbi:MAG: RNA ligase [Pseudomonadota bacterium]
MSDPPESHLSAYDYIKTLLKTGELATKYAGLIDIKEHPEGGLIILNYTEKCQFEGAWDEVTTRCRGLIFDTTHWELAALPFSKFFNLDERPESSIDALPAESFAVHEKLDGSLGISYRRSGEIALATRGSFDSVQAIEGTKFLRAQAEFANIPDDLTCLFEIVVNSSVVSRYDFQGLVLLSAFNRLTGQELPWSEVTALAQKIACKTPTVYPFASLEQAIASRAALPAKFEGYVIRFESGMRVKVKGSTYLALVKVAAGLTFDRILWAMAEGRIEEFRRDVPEEFLKDVDGVITDIHRQAAILGAAATAVFETAPQGSDRKAFSSWAQTVPINIRKSMFNMYEKRSYNWYKHMRTARTD